MGRYADYCPIAVGVGLRGDRRTPLVIRELMVGAERDHMAAARDLLDAVGRQASR
jgi:hypothetical protein